MINKRKERNRFVWLIGGIVTVLVIFAGVLYGLNSFSISGEKEISFTITDTSPASVIQAPITPAQPTQTPDSIPTKSPTPTIHPTNSPPLGAEELTRMQMTLQQGEKVCTSIYDAFGFPFYDPLVRAIYPRYFFLNYSVEAGFEWLPGLQGEFEPNDANQLCIIASKDLPKDNYYIPYKVVIYKEKGLIPDQKTRTYLTEGRAYLLVKVGVKGTNN